jgi:hypothetical protein
MEGWRQGALAKREQIHGKKKAKVWYVARSWNRTETAHKPARAYLMRVGLAYAHL